MEGRIHSIETSGMVDGPGIRYVIFTQGCLLRCQYCHNPDSWDRNGGELRSVRSLIDDIKRYIPYMKYSNGGVTVSGGEPLLQTDFLIELFKECKKLGIHTAIDSSGGCYAETEEFQSKFSALTAVTDLFLVDLKQIDNEKHRKLTGSSNTHILKFAEKLSDLNKKIWIRHVLVPGITDNETDLRRLGAFISSLQNVEKVEVLPYHKMGVYKWNELGMPYALEHINPPDENTVQFAKNILIPENTTKTG